jgi:hypothetical protein
MNANDTSTVTYHSRRCLHTPQTYDDDTQESFYETAFHYCFRAMDVRLVNEFLSRGADANGCDYASMPVGMGDDPPFLLSFLHLACGAVFPAYTSAPLVEALIKHGAGVNQRACWMENYNDEYNGMTPLDFAAWATCQDFENQGMWGPSGRAREREREKDKKNWDSQFLENQKKTVQILLENGANPETVMPRLKQLEFTGTLCNSIITYISYILFNRCNSIITYIINFT